MVIIYLRVQIQLKLKLKPTNFPKWISAHFYRIIPGCNMQI